MKKTLKEIFSITRNERIGLLCLIVVIAIILLVRVFCSESDTQSSPHNEANNTTLTVLEIDSIKTDTIKKKRSKKKKTNNTPHEVLTISSMKEVETFD